MYEIEENKNKNKLLNSNSSSILLHIVSELGSVLKGTNIQLEHRTRTKTNMKREIRNKERISNESTARKERKMTRTKRMKSIVHWFRQL